MALSETAADAFARAWVASWNSHDPDRIVAHYRDDVGYRSPFIEQIRGGRPLAGRAALRDYVAAALDHYPGLHFGPDQLVAVGVDSVAIVYRSVNDLAAVEILVLDDAGLVRTARCHYRAAPHGWPYGSRTEPRPTTSPT